MTAPTLARAETIAVGTELLALGRVDTNSGVIADRLSRIGIDVVARSIVGDQLPHLELAVRTALQRADLLVLTGGLGPTDDDLTRLAVARALGRDLREDPVQLARIVERFARRGIPMADINRRQALLVEGAARLDNPNGTAPGQWIELGPQAVALLPGPPREMVPMLDALVSERLAGRTTGARTHGRVLKVAGRSESAVEATLHGLYAKWRAAAPAIDATILAARGRIELHLFARSDDAVAAGAALADAVDEAVRALGSAVYTTGPESLEQLAGRLLRAANWRVAVAESCTGGMLGSRLTEFSGSSDWFEGGVIAYSNAVKVALTHVPPALLEAHGAVSDPVARALARGVRQACGTEVGIGITGIAGPEGGSEAKPVGTVFIALSTPDTDACRHARLSGDRTVIRQQSVTAALDMLRLALTGHDPVRVG